MVTCLKQTSSQISFLFLTSIFLFSCAEDMDNARDELFDYDTILDRTIPTTDLNDMFVDESTGYGDLDPDGTSDQYMMDVVEHAPVDSSLCTIAEHQETNIILELCTASTRLSEMDRCGILGDLNDTLKQEIENYNLIHDSSLPLSETICTDLDGDCFYACSGWTLSSDIHDPDDYRSSIPGQPINFVDNLEDHLSCIEDLNVLDEESGVQTCRYLLTEEEQDSNLRIFPCLDNGFVKVSPIDSDGLSYELSIDWFDEIDQELELTFQLMLAPQKIVCSRGLIGENRVIKSFADQIYSLSLTGTWEPLLLDGTRLRTYSLEVNDESVQWGTYHLIDLEEGIQDQEPLKVFRSQSSYVSEIVTFEISPDAKEVQLTCLDCDLNRDGARIAYLSNGSAELIDEAQLMTSYSLFPELGPFRVLKSSANLLGLVPEGEQIENLYFSLWRDGYLDGSDDSLVHFPFIFNAQQWGYESVQLLQIVDMRALLSLKEREGKEKWGVYSVLTDQLILLENLISPTYLEMLGIEGELTFRTPNLHGQWLSWPVQVNTDSTEPNDSNENLEILMLNLDVTLD